MGVTESAFQSPIIIHNRGYKLFIGEL